MRSLLFTLLLIACANSGLAQELARRNWFNDPFFQISSAIPHCLVPAGPFITEEEKRAQTHHRAERGTTCWLSGQCDKPNYYAYDADIAQALQSAFQGQPVLKHTTLWVTVQGRVVYIEGCAQNAAIAKTLESLARKAPHVQQAVVSLYSSASSRLPYKPLVERAATP